MAAARGAVLVHPVQIDTLASRGNTTAANTAADSRSSSNPAGDSHGAAAADFPVVWIADMGKDTDMRIEVLRVLWEDRRVERHERDARAAANQQQQQQQQQQRPQQQQQQHQELRHDGPCTKVVFMAVLDRVNMMGTEMPVSSSMIREHVRQEAEDNLRKTVLVPCKLKMEKKVSCDVLVVRNDSREEGLLEAIRRCGASRAYVGLKWKLKWNMDRVAEFCAQRLPRRCLVVAVGGRRGPRRFRGTLEGEPSLAGVQAPSLPSSLSLPAAGAPGRTMDGHLLHSASEAAGPADSRANVALASQPIDATGGNRHHGGRFPPPTPPPTGAAFPPSAGSPGSVSSFDSLQLLDDLLVSPAGAASPQMPWRPERLEPITQQGMVQVEGSTPGRGPGPEQWPEAEPGLPGSSNPDTSARSSPRSFPSPGAVNEEALQFAPHLSPGRTAGGPKPPSGEGYAFPAPVVALIQQQASASSNSSRVCGSACVSGATSAGGEGTGSAANTLVTQDTLDKMREIARLQEELSGEDQVSRLIRRPRQAPAAYGIPPAAAAGAAQAAAGDLYAAAESSTSQVATTGAPSLAGPDSLPFAVKDSLQEFSWSQVSAACCGFSPQNLIRGGEGALGLGMAEYRGVLDSSAVAIKTYEAAIRRSSGEQDAEKLFQEEVTVQRSLRHPGVVLLMGYCRSPPCLVYEAMPQGSLYDRLTLKGGSAPLPWRLRLSILEDVAKGLHICHIREPEPIVVLDLNPRNVLLSRGFSAKLADVGSARFLMTKLGQSRSTFLQHSFSTGAGGYVDPAFSQRGCDPTPSCDVYSLGMLVRDVLLGIPPALVAREDQGGGSSSSAAAAARRELREREDKMEESVESGDVAGLASVLDKSAGAWPGAIAMALGTLFAGCLSNRPRDRPRIASEILPLLDSLREPADIAYKQQQEEERVRKATEASRVPDYYICPITLEVMDDPVTLSDGHTYEREAIEDWLSRSSTSPYTGLPLRDVSLFENHDLRMMIQGWKEQREKQKQQQQQQQRRQAGRKKSPAVP